MSQPRPIPPQALLPGDPLARLVTLHPVVVGAVFLVFGWGTLLLLAWRLGIVTSEFLRSPAFMVGDLVLLPLCGALIASFYRSSGPAAHLLLQGWIVYISGAIALAAAGATAAFSILVTETYHGLWSVPHTLFIGFFAYVFVSFIPRGFVLIAFNLSSSSIVKLVLILALPIAHIVLKVAVGGSLP